MQTSTTIPPPQPSLNFLLFFVYLTDESINNFDVSVGLNILSKSKLLENLVNFF